MSSLAGYFDVEHRDKHSVVKMRDREFVVNDIRAHLQYDDSRFRNPYGRDWIVDVRPATWEVTLLMTELPRPPKPPIARPKKRSRAKAYGLRKPHG